MARECLPLGIHYLRSLDTCCCCVISIASQNNNNAQRNVMFLLFYFNLFRYFILFSFFFFVFQKRIYPSDFRSSPRARAVTNLSKWAIMLYCSVRPPVIHSRPYIGLEKVCDLTWTRTRGTQFSTKDFQVCTLKDGLPLTRVFFSTLGTSPPGPLT